MNQTFGKIIIYFIAYLIYIQNLRILTDLDDEQYHAKDCIPNEVMSAACNKNIATQSWNVYHF